MAALIDWEEARRLRAFELREQGWSQQRIAEAFGVTKGAVSQWVKAGTEGGVEALCAKPRPGRPPKLRRERWNEILKLLAQGAEAFDFRGDVWVSARVAAVVKRELGVTYSKSQMSRILHQLEWTPQKPIQRASQRDEARIVSWPATEWDELKKRRGRKSGHLFL